MAAKQESLAQAPEASASAPTEEEIRQRAFEIYRERHGRPGSALDDWLRAEAELKSNREALTFHVL